MMLRTLLSSAPGAAVCAGTGARGASLSWASRPGGGRAAQGAAVILGAAMCALAFSATLTSGCARGDDARIATEAGFKPIDTDPYRFTSGGWWMGVAVHSDLSVDTRPNMGGVAIVVDAERALDARLAVGGSAVWVARWQDRDANVNGQGDAHGAGLGDSRVWVRGLLLDESLGPELSARVELGLPTGRTRCGVDVNALATGGGHAWGALELEARKRLHPMTLMGVARGQWNDDFECAGRQVSPGHAGSLTGGVGLWVNSRLTASWAATFGYQARTRIDGVGAGDSRSWVTHGPQLTLELEDGWRAHAEVRFTQFGDLPGVGFGLGLRYRHD